MVEKALVSKPLLITIDGPCASGKTTLARKLSAALNCDVLHMDDFVVPHTRKTEERLSIPGGNCDWERLTRTCLRRGNRAVLSGIEGMTVTRIACCLPR